MTDSPSHAVAIIGGATAGAEVADRLVKSGVEVYVFEQNKKPYGKIEDGLPRWHVALRNKEYANIKRKLSQPGVHFIPNTKIGRDLDFAELANGWGLSAVVLACGAWRDRPVPIDGADDYVGKGLLYQNPFIISFNHQGDPDYDGPHYESRDGALILGGGLASLDVAKVLMLETTVAELRKRGHEIDDMEELEKKGLPKACEELGVKWEDLGLKGCTLYYRRRPEDMPLASAPPGADAARIAKVEGARKKILDKAMDKFRFHFEGLSTPESLIVEDGRLVGLGFRRVKRGEGRKLIPTDETYEARGPLIVSSIGSIPEPMPGVKMKGELLPFTDWDLGRMDGFPTVFGAGNVVTGKGNIVASRKHATQIGAHLAEHFLGVGDPDKRAAAEAEIADKLSEGAADQAAEIAERVTGQPGISRDALETSREKVKALQAKASFDGNLEAWLG